MQVESLFLVTSVLVWGKQKPRIFPAGPAVLWPHNRDPDPASLPQIHFFGRTVPLPPAQVPCELLVFRAQRYCLLEEPRSIFQSVKNSLLGCDSSTHSTAVRWSPQPRLVLPSTSALGSVRDTAGWGGSLMGMVFLSCLGYGSGSRRWRTWVGDIQLDWGLS